MTDSSVPLSPDVVDELLSAELDGEFDAAASDHDLSPAAARARLAATPGSDERRAALAAARTAVAVGPVPDDVRARMLATAMADTAPTDELGVRREQRGRRARLVVGLSAAAAALLLVVGLVATVATDSGDDSEVTADAGAGEAFTEEPEALTPGADRDDAGDGAAADVAEEAAPPNAATGAAAGIPFGLIPDIEWLRNRVGVELGYTAYSYEPQLLDESASGLARTSPQPAGCVTQLATDFRVEPEPALRGTGVFEETPVEVLVFATGTDYMVLVVGADSAVLGSTAVGPEP